MLAFVDWKAQHKLTENVSQPRDWYYTEYGRYVNKWRRDNPDSTTWLKRTSMTERTPSQEALDALLEEVTDMCDWLDCTPSLENLEKSLKRLNSARMQYATALAREKRLITQPLAKPGSE